MEIEGVDCSSSKERFPFSALRVLGGLQVALGLSCVTLGATDVIMLTLNYEAQAARYGQTAPDKARFQTLTTLTLTSAPVWCGTWFLVTGSIGSCVSQARAHSLKFLKITFLVLSVLCSAFFAPACAIVSCIVAVIRHTMDSNNLVWLLSTAAAFLAFCEMGLAIIGASICCCCSPLPETKVHILFADADAPPDLPAKKTAALRRREEPNPHRQHHHHHQPLPRKPANRKPRLIDADVQTEPPPSPSPSPPPPPPPKPQSLPPMTSLPLVQPPQRRLADPRYPSLQRRRLERDWDDEYDGYDGGSPSSGEASFDKLRRWAVPNGRLY